jgi:glycosyltransferase involved in cell wall biosynthesis
MQRDNTIVRSQSSIPRHTIIVPAFDEGDGLSVVLSRVLSIIDSTYEVIVVDDGSSDNTSAVARSFACRVIKHDRNQGKGAAVRTGLSHSRGVNVVWIDADGTYPVVRITDLVRELEAGYDLVVARRDLGRKNIPLLNRVGNRLLRLVAVSLYGRIPRDPFTGLCGAKREHLERMVLESNRFGIEIEVVVKSARMGLRVGELPIAYERRIGQTKLGSIKAGFEILSAILRFRDWLPDFPLFAPNSLLSDIGGDEELAHAMRVDPK